MGERLMSPTLPADHGRAGEWQLVRKSFPVAAGAEHNYLALQFVPHDGAAPELAGELHGLNDDGTEFGHFTMGSGQNLVGVHTRGTHWGPPPTDKHVVLARGDFDTVVDGHWRKAQDEVVAFNRKPDRVYRFDEQNSNNFARSLVDRLGLGAASGRWDGNHRDYGAHGFNYNPGQWNVRDVFGNDAVTRKDLRQRDIRSLEEQSLNRWAP